MGRKIKPEMLGDEISKLMKEYTDVTSMEVENAVDSVSKETKKIAQAGSPRKHSGYSRGWSVKKQKLGKGKVEMTVHNRKKPGLTHLLEKGHAKRGGGRVAGRTHIAPAEQYAVSRLESEIKRRIKT
jgi:hypothetical protein